MSYLVHGISITGEEVQEVREYFDERLDDGDTLDEIFIAHSFKAVGETYGLPLDEKTARDAKDIAIYKIMFDIEDWYKYLQENGR